jgi:hypothetical protein
VKVWTAHLHPAHPPALVRDGFSFGAFLFGPLWLALHRAWIPAVLALVATVLIMNLTGPPVGVVLLLGEMVLLGLSGRDLVRWSMARRGYTLVNAVVARNADAALLRLLDARPELAGRYVS